MPPDLDGLNPEQKDAAAHRGGPLLVLAGAGTGKTRVIVHRIGSLIEEGVAPGRILAVTFTNKAAEEMRKRVEALCPGRGAQVWVHTFHAFAARVLRRHAERVKLSPRFTVYDTDDQKRLVVESLKELGLQDEKNKAGLYVSVISRAKDDLLDAQSYGIYAMAQRDPFRQTVARVYELYQRKLDATGSLDFGDLLLKTAELLKIDQATREYYQELFQHVLVDEYQDTNHAQYILTKTLAAKHRNLCCVGDPDQSIYAWRGAHIRNILEFESDFKETRVVKLEQNYRSTPNILNAATSVIRNNKQRAAKTLWTKNGEGESVSSEEYADEREEARAVGRKILQLLDAGVPPQDIAVFYRTNAQSRQFEEALSLVRVPYRVVGSVRFYERKEIKDALAYARVALNPADSVSLSRILNVPTRGLGKTAQEALGAYSLQQSVSLLEALKDADRIPSMSASARRGARELAALLEKLGEDFKTLSPTDAISAVLQRTGYWAAIEQAAQDDPEEATRLGNLQELVNAIKEFEDTAAEKPARLEHFLEGVSLHSGADGYEAQAPAVTLMTIHLAKGLEFPAVFVTGLEEGLFPIAAGNASPEELEEERRLCYVAMTRARKILFLTYAATRRLFGKVYSNLPSRFILEARLMGLKEEDRPAAAAAPASEPVVDRPALRVKPGMRVRHPEFGFGKIVDRTGSGEAMKVTVQFDNGVTRKLLVRYAPLAAA
ncbi:MAG TPA: UvrD-helicase domain-containing protein [Elusimicrobiota bacterium]|nr:UvrD-helicase domain-containing protein [Elusimicrobiota bacterium]